MALTPKDDRVLPPFKRATETREDSKSVEPVTNDNFTFYGVAHNQSAVQSFRILFADGKMAVIQYHDLISPLTYDGEGLIELRTWHVVVKIIGRNLSQLFYNLAESRVSWVKEPDSSFIGHEPEIEAIRIEERL